MVLDEDSWYVVRNTPGVTGFVGMGNDPTPLREDEVKHIIDRMLLKIRRCIPCTMCLFQAFYSRLIKSRLTNSHCVTHPLMFISLFSKI